MNLEEFLIFLTGTNIIPVTGFDAVPTIDFTDRDRLPEASTCGLILTLSRNFPNYESFCGIMKRAILESCGYGKL